MKIVGLVPAAGLGSRLAPIPCSKELFPIGFSAEKKHPKVVSEYLLENYRQAGAEQVYVVLRKGKWDIPEYYGDGSQLDLNLAYLIMQRPYGTPFSLDQAYTFVQDKQVLFGFPDILIEPSDAFTHLLKKQSDTRADIVLGLFDIAAGQDWDLVDTDENGLITRFKREKVADSSAVGWAIACWGPKFTKFMHEYLAQVHHNMIHSGQETELRVGDVFQAALSNGLQIQSVYFSACKCLDVGTPENLRQAVRSLY